MNIHNPVLILNNLIIQKINAQKQDNNPAIALFLFCFINHFILRPHFHSIPPVEFLELPLNPT
jgi:hypothetical protein